MNHFRHALVSGTGALCFVASTLSIATLSSTSSTTVPASIHTLGSSPIEPSQGEDPWLDVRPSRPNPSKATASLWQNQVQVDDSLSVNVLKEQHRLMATSGTFVKLDSNVKGVARGQNASNARPILPKHDMSRANSSRGPASEEDTSLVALVPENLIPIYKAAGSRYNIPWTVLAAIHKTETDFGTGDCPVSSAGAEGPMQFEPSTFEAYAVKAPGHAGPPNIQNVDDAIYTAANMLAKKGFSNSPSQAIFAYNHSNWYVKRITTLAGI